VSSFFSPQPARTASASRAARQVAMRIFDTVRRPLDSGTDGPLNPMRKPGSARAGRMELLRTIARTNMLPREIH
jgi:hypothetical protein